MLLPTRQPHTFLHRGVYDALKQKILDRELSPDDKLPSVRNLAHECGVSINTVNAAYYLLEEEGYVRAVPRVGFFVNAIDHLTVLESSLPTKEHLPISTTPVYDFSYGGVDPHAFPLSVWRACFRSALHETDPAFLRDGDPKGIYALRESIARYLKDARGILAHPDRILVSAGTEHLFMVLRRLLPRGVRYAFEDPGVAWGNAFYTAGVSDAIALPLDAQGAVLDPVADVPACACLLTPAHQFPMGMLYSIGRRVEWLNWAAAHPHRYLIEDDYDGEFKAKGVPIPPCKSMDATDSVIYIGSFSRSLTPALRISYMVLPATLMKEYERMFAGFGCPVSLFVQKALTEFMNKGHLERHINRMRRIYAEKQSALRESLESMPGVVVHGTDSGMSLVAELDWPSGEDDFLERARDRGVAVTGLSRFYRNPTTANVQVLMDVAQMTKEQIYDGVSILGTL